MNRTILTLAALVAIVSLTGQTSAAGRGAWRMARPVPQAHPAQAPLEMAGPPMRVAPPSSFSPFQSSRENYPKYYGGFHSRHLQNIGIPTGDIGIRGNGFYATPW